MGARPAKDGLSTTAFPSGVGAIPVEITEAQSPLLFRRRELSAGSGGEGRQRGGMGVRIEIENSEHAPFSIACATFDRRHNPARGRAGGADGRVGRVALASGKVLPGKETYLVPAGDCLVAEMPGGGGYGNASSAAARGAKEAPRIDFPPMESAPSSRAGSASRRASTSWPRWRKARCATRRCSASASISSTTPSS